RRHAESRPEALGRPAGPGQGHPLSRVRRCARGARRRACRNGPFMMKLAYQSGFGNTFSTEAARGALPADQNSPQRAPRGLYAELMLVPQQGGLTLFSELGVLSIEPGEIAVIPRGTKFKVDLEGPSRGYVCENYGTPFRLPELGPIGSQGLAQKRHFLAPVAA